MARVETVEYRPNPMRIGMAAGVMEARFASLMRWATPESFAVFSACITVSGYATVPAARLHRNGQHIGTVTHATSLAAFAWGMRPRMTRCHFHACRKWEVPAQPRLELGWAGFCDTCVERFVRVCRRLHGRLPDVAREFFCPYCLRMRRHPEDRCTPDNGGQVIRIRCIECRRADWRRTWNRRSKGHRARGTA